MGGPEIAARFGRLDVGGFTVRLTVAVGRLGGTETSCCLRPNVSAMVRPLRRDGFRTAAEWGPEPNPALTQMQVQFVDCSILQSTVVC